MAKRFISPDWKQLRRFPEHLQRAWFYLWDKADSCGVYHYDPDYLKLDLSLDTPPTLSELARLPECKLLDGDRILLTDFIRVNYVALKPNYNPHKPAFRDLDKNKLKLASSLNEACVKLEEEDEEEDILLGTSDNTGTREEFSGFPAYPKPTDIPAPPANIIQTIIECQYRIGAPGLTPDKVLEYWGTWVAIEYTGILRAISPSDVHQHFARHCNKVKIKVAVPAPQEVAIIHNKRLL